MSESDLTGNLLYGFGPDDGGSLVGISVEEYKQHDADKYTQLVYDKDPCLRSSGRKVFYFVLPMPDTTSVNWFREYSYLNRWCTDYAEEVHGLDKIGDKSKAYQSVNGFERTGNQGCYIGAEDGKVYTNKRDAVAAFTPLLNGKNIVCVQSA